EYRQTIEEIRKQGFVRVRVDGAMHEVTDEIPLDRYKQHTIEVVVDRLVRRDGIESRLAESIETALKLGTGILGILWESPAGEEGAKGPQEMLFSEHFACVECGISIEELAPRNFSFNSPYGACPECHGLGTRSEFDGELILDPEKSLETGAVIPFATTSSEYIRQILEAVGRRYGHEPTTALSEWKREAIKTLLNGSSAPLPISYTNRYGRRRSYQAHFEGLIEMLKRRYSETSSQNTKEDLERFMATRPCPACRGARRKPERLGVPVGGIHISDFTRQPVSDALAFLDGLDLTERQATIGRQILKEIRTRLGFLKDVGLDYLTLDRAAATLAGGEAQRI